MIESAATEFKFFEMSGTTMTCCDHFLAFGKIDRKSGSKNFKDIAKRFKHA